MKIVFLGDELIQGLPGASIVDCVATGLRGHHFVNQGRHGDTSLNLYRRAQSDVLALQPQAVFLMAGLHDALSRSEPALRPWYRWHKRIRGGRLSPIACRENLRALLEMLRRNDMRTFVALPPAEYRPQLVTALREVNSTTQQLCESLQVPVLNLQLSHTPTSLPQRPPLQLLPWLLRTRSWQLRAPDFERLRERGGFSYSCDGLQPTPAGAQQIAEEIVTFLRRNGLSG